MQHRYIVLNNKRQKAFLFSSLILGKIPLIILIYWLFSNILHHFISVNGLVCLLVDKFLKIMHLILTKNFSFLQILLLLFLFILLRAFRNVFFFNIIYFHFHVIYFIFSLYNPYAYLIFNHFIYLKYLQIYLVQYPEFTLC